MSWLDGFSRRREIVADRPELTQVADRPQASHDVGAAEPPAIMAANLAPLRRRYFDPERGVWVEDDRGETPDLTGAVRGKLWIVGPGWLDKDHLPE
jgi:hypothetical protein